MSGSVFRRQGQKTEVQGKPNEVHFDQEQLQQKLEELQKTLSVPLAASSQSVATWHPEYQVAEVTMQRGSTLPRMGFKWRRKLFLHAEEALYLVSKGNLLLHIQDHTGQQQLLSLQAATSLLVSAGVSMEKYQVYSRLMRAGYIVTRHPATWVVQDDRRPYPKPLPGMHQAATAPAAVIPSPAKCDAATSTDAPAACNDVNHPAQPPLKRAKRDDQGEAKDLQPHRAWWPAMFMDSNDDLQLRSQVVLAEQERRLPHLLTFGQIHARVQPKAVADGSNICVGRGSVLGQDQVQLAYDVLRPNKHFSKNKPDAPQLVVALASGDFVPTLSIIATLQNAADRLPLRYARVSGGEVSFHSIQAT